MSPGSACCTIWSGYRWETSSAGRESWGSAIGRHRVSPRRRRSPAWHRRNESSAKMGPDFTEEQKRYLEGFFAGLLMRRGAGTGSPPTPPGANGGTAMPSEPTPAGPEAIHRAAQDRFLAAGKKLTAEEMAKRAKNPLDMWDEMRANAEAGRFPKGTDVFLHKFHGLFYVAPTQDAFMCRLRIPNGVLNAHQLAGIADVAERRDIGFSAVAVGEGQEAPAGVYFRVLLGGITGHGDFGRDAGLLILPEECTPVAIALVRAFIDHGDRTDRKKARLKYVLDRLGIDG